MEQQGLAEYLTSLQSSSPLLNPITSAEPQYGSQITGIEDADTFFDRINRPSRLMGVDALETLESDKSKAIASRFGIPEITQQVYGQEAKDYVQNLLTQPEYRQFEQKGFDYYNRPLLNNPQLAEKMVGDYQAVGMNKMDQKILELGRRATEKYYEEFGADEKFQAMEAQREYNLNRPPKSLGAAWSELKSSFGRPIDAFQAGALKLGYDIADLALTPLGFGETMNEMKKQENIDKAVGYKRYETEHLTNEAYHNFAMAKRAEDPVDFLKYAASGIANALKAGPSVLAESIPMMGAMAIPYVGLPVYTATQVNNRIEERVEANGGREFDITSAEGLKEFTGVVALETASAYLERFAFKKSLGLGKEAKDALDPQVLKQAMAQMDDLAKETFLKKALKSSSAIVAAAGTEALQEYIQTGLQQISGEYGTDLDKSYSLIDFITDDDRERERLKGAIAGAGAGATVRGVVESAKTLAAVHKERASETSDTNVVAGFETMLDNLQEPISFDVLGVSLEQEQKTFTEVQEQVRNLAPQVVNAQTGEELVAVLNEAAKLPSIVGMEITDIKAEYEKQYEQNKREAVLGSGAEKDSRDIESNPVILQNLDAVIEAVNSTVPVDMAVQGDPEIAENISTLSQNLAIIQESIDQANNPEYTGIDIESALTIKSNIEEELNKLKSEQAKIVLPKIKSILSDKDNKQSINAVYSVLSRVAPEVYTPVKNTFESALQPVLKDIKKRLLANSLRTYNTTARALEQTRKLQEVYNKKAQERQFKYQLDEEGKKEVDAYGRSISTMNMPSETSIVPAQEVATRRSQYDDKGFVTRLFGRMKKDTRLSTMQKHLDKVSTPILQEQLALNSSLTPELHQAIQNTIQSRVDAKVNANKQVVVSQLNNLLPAMTQDLTALEVYDTYISYADSVISGNTLDEKTIKSIGTTVLPSVKRARELFANREVGPKHQDVLERLDAVIEKLEGPKQPVQESTKSPEQTAQEDTTPAQDVETYSVQEGDSVPSGIIEEIGSDVKGMQVSAADQSMLQQLVNKIC
jgi:hypothetical protein